MAREALAAWARVAVGGDPALRLVDAASLHLTLAFLGPVEEEGAWPLRAAIRAAASERVPVPGLSSAGVLWLAPRRPHVLTVAVEDAGGGLADLHARLWRELVELGFRREARTFRPHVTVARVRRGTRPARLELASPPATSFQGEAVSLMRSHLGGGRAARYEALERVTS